MLLNNSADSFLISSYNSEIVFIRMMFSFNQNNFFLLIISTLKINESILADHLCINIETGCFIKGIDGSIIIIENSYLFSTIHLKYGEFFYLESSELFIKKTSFSSIYVNASLISSINSEIITTNSTFQKMNLSIYNIFEGNLSIFQTNFIGNYASNIKLKEILKGVIVCSRCTYFMINESLIFNNEKSQDGGAIRISSFQSNNDHLKLNFIITQCKFLKNYAFDKGGAIYIENSNVLIFDNYFAENEANYGGALYISSEIDSSVIIEVNVFEKNQGYIEGGGIKWDKTIPIINFNNKFINNTALYGNDIASYPIKMKVFIIKDKEKKSLMYFLGNETNSKFILLPNIVSGETLPFDIYLELIDHYNMVVSSIDQSKLFFILEYKNTRFIYRFVSLEFANQNIINQIDTENEIIYDKSFKYIYGKNRIQTTSGLNIN